MHLIMDSCLVYVVGLQSNISESNSTYQSVKRVGSAVSSQFSALLSLVNSLSLVGEYGNRPHSLEQSASRTSQQSVNITNTGTGILGESRSLQQNMTEMTSTIRGLNSTSAVAIEELNQAWITSKLSVTISFLWWRNCTNIPSHIVKR